MTLPPLPPYDHAVYLAIDAAWPLIDWPDDTPRGWPADWEARTWALLRAEEAVRAEIRAEKDAA